MARPSYSNGTDLFFFCCQTVPLLYSHFLWISFPISCKRQKQLWHFRYSVLRFKSILLPRNPLSIFFISYYFPCSVFASYTNRLTHFQTVIILLSTHIYLSKMLKRYIIHSCSRVLLKRKFFWEKNCNFFMNTVFFCWVSQQLIMYRMLSTKINFDSDYGKILNVCLLQRLAIEWKQF